MEQNTKLALLVTFAIVLTVLLINYYIARIHTYVPHVIILSIIFGLGKYLLSNKKRDEAIMESIVYGTSTLTSLLLIVYVMQRRERV
jgi:uncharacterized membrane protein